MAISAAKVLPSGVVLAFVGYCSWASIAAFVSPPPPPPPPPKAPTLAASLFSPQLPPPPTRNPWGGLDAAALAAQRQAASQSATAEKGPAKSVDPLDTLRLEATCILNDQRIAMINGQLFGLKSSPGITTSTPAFKVLNVLPDKVVLESKGRKIELTYEGIIRPKDALKDATSTLSPDKKNNQKIVSNGNSAVSTAPTAMPKTLKKSAASTQPSTAQGSPTAGK